MYHYSNIGYMVAGLVAERAGRADLATLFRQRLIEPLRLKRTAYDPAPQIGGDHARGNGRTTDSRGDTRAFDTMRRLYCAA